MGTVMGWKSDGLVVNLTGSWMLRLEIWFAYCRRVVTNVRGGLGVMVFGIDVLMDRLL